MKLLKSGIEMDPSQLRKVKGSMCACGCGIGVSADTSSDIGVDGEICFCDCIAPLEKTGMLFSAARQFPRP